MSLTPFLCCYVFLFYFVEGEGGSSRSQWQKHFDQQAMTFLSFFFFGAEHTHTHTTPAAAVFVQPDKQQWPTKNAYKNRRSLVYTFCCSASHAGLAGIINNSSMQPATQPMNYGESVREEGERENGCTIGALFSLWTFTHFYEEKKMINDGRVMCRTTMPLRWMNEGLLPHVYVYIYTTTIMTWGWNQKKEEKSWE